MVISASRFNTSENLRDFKKYTSKAIIQVIENHTGESRKEWMLKLFAEKGLENERNAKFQFWRQDNQPKEIYSDWFFEQKVDYIHHNPVLT